MKNFFATGVLCLMIMGCATNQKYENEFDYDGLSTTKVTLSAPNISAQHLPPVMVGVAYLNVYDKDVFCEKNKGILGEAYKVGEPIGKIYAHKKQRIREGLIPVGDVIIKTGFSAGAAGGGGLECGNYLAFETKEGYEYEVEVKESRPLLTKCYLSIKEKNANGNYVELTELKAGKERGFFRILDLSKICEL